MAHKTNDVLVKKDDRIKIHLFGPTSCGKGYITKQMIQYFKIAYGLTVDVIGTGEAIRKKFETDFDFRRQWLDIVKNGDLVSNDVITEMYDELYRKGPNNGFMLINDGYPRDVEQTEHVNKLGLMDSNSLSLMIKASKSTCLARAEHRQANKIDGNRVDADSFKKRYWSHQLTAPCIQRHIIQKTSSQLIHVDADRDLNEVFDDVLSYVALKLPRQENIVLARIPDRLPSPRAVAGAALA